MWYIMAIKRDEINNYNRMIRNLRGIERYLAETYLRALEDVQDKVAAFRQRMEKGELPPGSSLQLKRLEALNADIDQRLKLVINDQQAVIKDGFIKEWNDSYLNTAFNIEKEVNLNASLIQGNYDVSVGFRQLNDGYLRSVFNAPIGGQTFTDRMLRDRLLLQGQVKQAVSQAIVEGLSVNDLKDRLKAIDAVFETNRNKALLTAQQELTTAYSYGQRDAIDTAMDNGVEGEHIWSATLDGKTRPDHAREDGQKRDEETGLFTLADGSTIESPRIIGTGTAGLKQIMRCRCRMLFLPFGIKPTKRLAKLEDGTWEEVNGDMTWEEWAKTQEGKATIEEEVAYRKARAARLKKRREAAA